MSRKHIPLRTQLAAALCAMLELPHDIAKTLTEDEIIGLVQWDHHPVRHADGGPDVHHNLVPRFRQDHIEKTRRDLKDMAKERRVRRAQAHHEDEMRIKAADPGSVLIGALTYSPTAIKPARNGRTEWTRWSSRPFPKRQRGFGR